MTTSSAIEDGRKLKSMKRYLAGLGVTPAECRAEWGLSHDRPMASLAYARQRSEPVESIGPSSLRTGTM